jgi:hypothetical protein
VAVAASVTLSERDGALAGPASDEEINMLRGRFKCTIGIAGAASVAILAAGCVTVANPTPTGKLAVANAAIADAIGADASQYDAADLEKARRKLARANDEAAQGDYEVAQDLAEEAEVDARLAATRARSTKAARAAAAVQESIRALDEEVARTPH